MGLLNFFKVMTLHLLECQVLKYNHILPGATIFMQQRKIKNVCMMEAMKAPAVSVY